MFACSSIDEKAAAQSALSFARERGVFYTHGSSGTQSVQDFNLSVVSSVQTGNDWYESVQVSTVANGTHKKRIIPVIVGGNGIVKSFNGQAVK